MVCHVRSRKKFTGQGRRRNDDIIRRERASCVQRNETFIQGTSGKQRRWETSMQHNTEPAQCQRRRSGLEPRPCSASRSSFSTKARRQDVSSLTKGPLWSPRALENLVQHEEKFGNLPEDFSIHQSCRRCCFFLLEKCLEDKS